MDRVQFGGGLRHQGPKLDQDLMKLCPALRAHLGVKVSADGRYHDTRMVGEIGVSVPTDHLLVVQLLFGRVELLFQFQEAFDGKRPVLEHTLCWWQVPFLLLVPEGELLPKELLHLFTHFVAVALFVADPRSGPKAPSTPATSEISAPASSSIAAPSPSTVGVSHVFSVVLSHLRFTRDVPSATPATDCMHTYVLCHNPVPPRPRRPPIRAIRMRALYILC